MTDTDMTLMMPADPSHAPVWLEGVWRMALTAPAAFAHPVEAREHAHWQPIAAQSSVAEALSAVGCFDPDAPTPLHDQDVWYHIVFDAMGAHSLHLDYLASLTDVYLNDALVLQSRSAFISYQIPLHGSGETHLYLHFHSLDHALAQASGKRARWRVRMIDPPQLRLIRTPLLGHMPGWCPAIDLIGALHGIRLSRPAALSFKLHRVQADFHADGGVLDVELEGLTPLCDVSALELHCAGERIGFSSCDTGRVQARLTLPNIAPWWPHTHGVPQLYDVRLLYHGTELHRFRVGFRRIEVDHDTDGQGFGLKVNGVPVFCRGACWTPPSLTHPARTRDDYRPLLELAVNAHINMLRVSGTMLYEADAFHALCDEMGILVWQDFMFANFDYPVQDETFMALVTTEVDCLLTRLAASPSLAVLCGGSEVAQQAAMMGLPERVWQHELFTTVLPRLCQPRRPDVAYVVNSPFDGALPFVTHQGVSHYYGVGAYCRPLEDARRAQVRFASECLAFANIPQQRTLDQTSDWPAQWKARVPRDIGADWDFEDVREHYMQRLYGVNPAQLKQEEPERYLDLARAVVVQVIEATMQEWRRPASSCRGALVWLWRDFSAGAGWGIVDSLSRPKSAYYALQHSFSPVQLLLCDEGLNGLEIHVLNETAQPIEGRVHLRCLQNGRMVVAQGYQDVVVPARSSLSLEANAVLGAFFDTSYAYRFGAAAHDVTLVQWSMPENDPQEACHFITPTVPEPPDLQELDLGLSVELAQDATGWFLLLSTQHLARCVQIEDETASPHDNFFHLSPFYPRKIRLSGDGLIPPRGRIRALNSRQSLTYGVRA